MIYVKTTYDIVSMRKPNISTYETEKDANNFINICLNHGIGIESCIIIPESIALALIKKEEVDYIEEGN